MKKYPDFAEGWAALKPEDKKGFHNTLWLTDDAALNYALHLRGMAYQGTITPGWSFENLESIAVKDERFRRSMPPTPDFREGISGSL